MSVDGMGVTGCGAAAWRSDRGELPLDKLTRRVDVERLSTEAVMEIQPKKPSRKGPAEMFTGEVWLDPIATPQPPASFSVSAVHFSPGARTAWHSHSHGQTLHVTDGEGLIQSRGELINRIRSGDTIHTPADEWHWHGATPDHTMTHLTMTEGQPTWGEHVTDAEYHGDVAE